MNERLAAPGDRIAIEHLVQALETAWNTGDGSAFGSAMAPDADFCDDSGRTLPRARGHRSRSRCNLSNCLCRQHESVYGLSRCDSLHPILHSYTFRPRSMCLWALFQESIRRFFQPCLCGVRKVGSSRRSTTPLYRQRHLRDKIRQRPPRPPIESCPTRGGSSQVVSTLARLCLIYVGQSKPATSISCLQIRSIP